MATATEYTVRLRQPHEKQALFLRKRAKRKIVKAGRQSGKTTGVATAGVEGFLDELRILYAAPTTAQLGRFWFEVTRALADPIQAGVYRKNESTHTIYLPGTEQAIRAKTAWNADTLRGDYADLLILDEWQLMDEDAWELVGAPMLLKNHGDAIFIYTPPSLHSRSASKARDPLHAAKLFKAAQADTTGRWAAFHFTSLDNPHLSSEGLEEITHDMTALSYRLEILAEEVEQAPGALWTRELLEHCRVQEPPESLGRIVIGVDPPGGGTECGIVTAGRAGNHRYVLADVSLQASPERWAGAVLDLYLGLKADVIVGEANYGGDMVENTILGAARARGIVVNYQAVHATRGKAVRAEPCAAAYERGEVHHVGHFALLEDEMCLWEPGISPKSPNRMDALVWALTELGDAPAGWMVRWL